LSFVPASLTVLPGTASAQTTTPVVVPTILGGTEYPIGLWWPPPPSETTVERYQEIAAAGFNFVVGGNGVSNDDINPAALEAARNSSLRFLLMDGRLQRIIRFSANYSDPRAEVRHRIQLLLRRYGGNTALAGLNLYDEPTRQMFGLVGYAREALQGLAPNQLPYVNIWPSYVSSTEMGIASWEECLQLYLSEVKPPHLCFDHYPLLSGTEITSDYFYNWVVVRGHALRLGIPSWVFIQSIDYKPGSNPANHRRRPNEPEILWQANVSLAYGAKGIQYFTYWSPSAAPDAVTQFGEALVTVDGRLTPLYDYAKRVNSYLKVIGKVLLPLASESVVHAGENPLPRGATAFTPDTYVKSISGSPVILSKFRKPAGGTERYLLIVNRSFNNAANTQLTLDGSVRGVSELNSGTGTFAQVTPRSGGMLPLTIAPGAARLYLLKKTG
jgi:hypothetical protein